MGGLDNFPAGAKGLVVGLATGAVVLLLGAGPASAAGCDTSWKAAHSGQWSSAANWDNGVPTSGTNACIALAGTYTVSITGQLAEANSLQLGGASGRQTLSIIGASGFSGLASLSLGEGGSITPHGVVDLTDGCGSDCSFSPAASLVNTSSSATPLTNAGTISALSGSDQGVDGRQLAGDVVNTGTVSVETPLQYAAGVLDNRGTISLGNQVMTLLNGQERHRRDDHQRRRLRRCARGLRQHVHPGWGDDQSGVRQP
jgi:hypothetical protein